MTYLAAIQLVLETYPYNKYDVAIIIHYMSRAILQIALRMGAFPQP